MRLVQRVRSCGPALREKAALFLAVGVGEGGACRWRAMVRSRELCGALALVSVAPDRCRGFVNQLLDSNAIPKQQSDRRLRSSPHSHEQRRCPQSV